MRDLEKKLTTSGKSSKNIQSRRGKSFGYQVLGFGSGGGNPFIEATGGTISCSGDYKIHTFTGDGTFCVSNAASCAAHNKVDYFVVAGGGGGNWSYGGAGGGGFRYHLDTTVAPTVGAPAAPINNYGASPNTEVTVSVAPYSITVGAGGVGSPAGPAGSCNTAGAVSTFSTVTSTGGGKGGNYTSPGASQPGVPGGSGGGAGSHPGPPSPGVNPGAGSGNVPPTSPAQGYDGGNGLHIGCDVGGGGGGAMAVGGNAAPPYLGGNGGAGGGLPNAFGTSGQNCGSFYYFSGGAGGKVAPGNAAYGNKGIGGGGDGLNPAIPSVTGVGTVNTGGGGGGGWANASLNGGGSGIVIIRYKFK